MSESRSSSPFSTLIPRVLTALALGLVVLAAISFGGQVGTAILAAILAAGATSELLRLTCRERTLRVEAGAMLSAAALPIAAIWGITGLHIATAGVIVLVTTLHVRIRALRFADTSISLFASVYAGFCLAHLVLIRSFDAGLALSLTVIVSVWASDVFAYFVGSAFGRHPLAPLISPRKTWEGLIAGIVGAILVWVIAASFVFETGLPTVTSVTIGFAVAIAGVTGDLLASRIKREVGAKDSGGVFPGHGGVLDRFDSLILVSLVAYFAVTWGGAAV